MTEHRNGVQQWYATDLSRKGTCTVQQQQQQEQQTSYRYRSAAVVTAPPSVKGANGKSKHECSKRNAVHSQLGSPPRPGAGQYVPESTGPPRS